ncbi:glycine-rich protein [Segatella copri]|uniref:receptor protein-tyrosine kinase n=1 Tax=Segatella copri TaxID=165179 RepID=A0A6G1VNF6_9BACT|nr:fimbrillin family protein [Segatella copri]MQN59706.1 fimbrillin family protein [Segatella copri]MQP15085.1 fimbrillin family protein [Segatella copri]
MMKKTYKSSLLALSVLASFTSCSESESLQQANLSKDKITFHATLDNSWKPLSPASSSRAAIAAATEKGPIVVSTPFGKPLYLHSVVQETADLQQAAATTRGAMQEGTTLDNTYYNNSFGVTAISTNNGTNTALFTNQKASKNNEDIWEIEDKTNSRWPFDALVSFHAYAPFNETTDGMWSVTTDADNVKTKIKYTAKSGETEIPAQPDIVVATNAESRSVSSDDKAVELKFSHALTAVNFAISKDLTDIFQTGATDGSNLKSIKLSGIPNEGTCELTATEGAPQTPSQNWTFATDANGKKIGSYTFNLENKNITIGESYALTSNEDKNILMMIPQDLQGTDAKLTFVLDIKGKGDQTFTFDLSNQTWLPGTSVTYKLSASAVNHLENAEVKFPDSWKDTEQVKYSYPKTDFKEGESIGLYVVNSNNKIEGENLECVKQADGSWKIGDGNTKYLKLKNYKYFAYYPYSAAAPNVDVKKDKADEFFKDMITNWNPVKEQKTEVVLLSQDLQVGEGVIEGDASTLTFNMAHSMGLAVLNLKSKDVPVKRTFTTNNFTYYHTELKGRVTTEPAASEYTDATTKLSVEASTEFKGNIPFLTQATDKRYVQIVKPNVAATFKAVDETKKPRTAWGILKSYSFNVEKNQVVAKDITSDADFYYLARLFSFKGSTESFTVPVDGTYTLECWGAGENQGGKSQGDYQAPKDKILYICVGGKGTEGDRGNIGIGGYNGGGNGGTAVINEKGQPLKRGDGGSGATHICLKNGVLKDLKTAYENNQLLMVAGGQGGAQYPKGTGLFGGGTEGGKPTNKAGKTFGAATQSIGYAFGQGQTGRNGTKGTQNGGEGNGGGGGGLYGGYAPKDQGNLTNCPGGGGSGYVNKKLLNVDAKTIAGNQSFLSPSGVSETGHAGHGAALITWLP